MSRKWSIFKIYLYLFSNKIFWKLWLVFIIVWYVIPLHCSLEFYLISLGKQYYCLHVVIEWWCLCFITLMLINCIVRTCLFSPMIKHWLPDHLITWSLIVQNWVENEVQNTISHIFHFIRVRKPWMLTVMKLQVELLFTPEKTHISYNKIPLS